MIKRTPPCAGFPAKGLHRHWTVIGLCLLTAVAAQGCHITSGYATAVVPKLQRRQYDELVSLVSAYRSPERYTFLVDVRQEASFEPVRPRGGRNLGLSRRRIDLDRHLVATKAFGYYRGYEVTGTPSDFKELSPVQVVDLRDLSLPQRFERMRELGRGDGVKAYVVFSPEDPVWGGDSRDLDLFRRHEDSANAEATATDPDRRLSAAELHFLADFGDALDIWRLSNRGIGVIVAEPPYDVPRPEPGDVRFCPYYLESRQASGVAGKAAFMSGLIVCLAADTALVPVYAAWQVMTLPFHLSDRTVAHERYWIFGW